MKILYLTKYSRNGASSRLRSYQYFPLLNNEGIEITVKPFFDEEYLNRLYFGKGIPKTSVIKFYYNRLIALFSIYKFDKIVIEKELFPYFFSWFEKILHLLKVKYIVDYDDAIFHNYDLSTNMLIRFFLKNKIKNVMKYSDCVLAGNNYLAAKAKKSGATDIVIFPTVIDINRYKLKSHNSVQNKIIIGWIGSPSTFKYMQKLNAVFSRLNEKHFFELHIIGACETLDFNGCVKYLKWSEAAEANFIANLDIGIMPLEDTPWELGKCAYKIIQYMGGGLPVVASAIGMNKEVVDHGVNGFLAENESDWIEKLTELLNDAALRKKFGENGRQKIEREYNLHLNNQKLISLIKDGGNK